MSTMNEGAGALAQLSDALAAAVERAGASTLTVKARARIPASGIAWARDGLVVTCDHVIERDEDVVVGLPGGDETAATIVGRDAGSDLAVLRIGSAVALPKLAPAGETKVGHLALALGRLGPGDPMASLGVVSAIGGPWRTISGGRVDGYLRTDATFYPGFSGGPLVDVKGRVVGVNSSRLGRGAGMTIPAAAVGRIVDALVKQGRIRRGWLGIASQPARLPAALAAKLTDQESGLLVLTVEPDSPADRAGLLMGDILTAFSGAPLPDTSALQAVLGPESVGQTVELGLLRGGSPLTLSVTIGERR